MRDLVRIVRLESWSEAPITEIPRPLLHSYATVVSVLSRPRFLCRFTATGLTCEGIKKRANNGHPNSKSGRNVQQKMVEDVRSTAEIASRQKHSPAREQLVVASSMIPPDLVSGRAC